LEEWPLSEDKNLALEPLAEDEPDDTEEDCLLDGSSDESVVDLDQKELSPKKKRASSPPVSPVSNPQFLSTPESKVGSLAYSHYKKFDSYKCKNWNY